MQICTYECMCLDWVILSGNYYAIAYRVLNACEFMCAEKGTTPDPIVLRVFAYWSNLRSAKELCEYVYRFLFE